MNVRWMGIAAAGLALGCGASRETPMADTPVVETAAVEAVVTPAEEPATGETAAAASDEAPDTTGGAAGHATWSAAVREALAAAGSTCGPEGFAPGRAEALGDSPPRVVMHDGLVELELASSGVGAFAGHEERVVIVDAASCAVRAEVTVGWTTGDTTLEVDVAPPEALEGVVPRSRHFAVASSGSSATALFDLASRRRAPPAFRVRTAGPSSLVGPLYEAPPSLEGAPAPADRTVLVRERAVLVREGAVPGAVGRSVRFDAWRGAGVAEDVALDGLAPWALRTFALPGRARGVLVALVREGRHQYVLDTSALGGGTLAWLGVRSGFALGLTGAPEDGLETLVALELSSGRVFAIEVPGVLERGRVVAPHGGVRLAGDALTVGGRRVALGPLLALAARPDEAFPLREEDEDGAGDFGEPVFDE